MREEQIEKLALEILGTARVLEAYKETLTKWFERYPVKPVVVGLTDRQALSFVDAWRKTASWDAVNVYKEWAKTQTFALPETNKPSWANAPDSAMWLAQDRVGSWYWYAEKPYPTTSDNWKSNERGICATQHKNWQNTLDVRPQPVHPKIEVEQVWRNKHSNESVEIVGIRDMSRRWCMDYCKEHRYSPVNPYFWKDAVDAYNAKFERVGGE